MASEITCSFKQIKQCNQITPLCCVCTVGVGSRGSSFGGVNSSSSIDRCDNDDSGNAQMTITTVAMTVVCGLYCYVLCVPHNASG